MTEAGKPRLKLPVRLPISYFLRYLSPSSRNGLLCRPRAPKTSGELPENSG